jgi:hypothetical protein
MLKSVAVLHNSRKCSKKKNNDLTIASKIMLRSILIKEVKIYTH